MNLRAALVPLLFLGAVWAQESAPSNLSETNHPPICSGKDSAVLGCIAPPHTTYAPDPKYTKRARKAHKQGVVLLRVIVGSDGLPRGVEVARSLDPDLDQAAVDAVRKWKFDPATKDGKAVSVQINVEVNFRLY